MTSRSLQRRQLSRSKIDLFVECPRCLYLDVARGIRRPSGPPFTLNNAVDALMKAEFDTYRAASQPHPLFGPAGIDAVPFVHPGTRRWRTIHGVRWKDEETAGHFSTQSRTVARGDCERSSPTTRHRARGSADDPSDCFRPTAADDVTSSWAAPGFEVSDREVCLCQRRCAHRPVRRGAAGFPHDGSSTATMLGAGASGARWRPCRRDIPAQPRSAVMPLSRGCGGRCRTAAVAKESGASR